jgi:hypothetical protein
LLPRAFSDISQKLLVSSVCSRDPSSDTVKSEKTKCLQKLLTTDFMGRMFPKGQGFASRALVNRHSKYDEHHSVSQWWWQHRPRILELRRLRQEESEFETRLDCIVSWRPA